jgi:hypothetical protein
MLFTQSKPSPLAERLNSEDLRGERPEVVVLKDQ